MEKKVAVIGYGSIGKEIIAATEKGEIPNAKIVALFDKEARVIHSLDNDDIEFHLFTNFDEFYNSPIYSDLDVIIECASKDAVRDYGKKIIESRKDVIILSVGAFSDKQYLTELQNLSNLNKTRILIPTGAIAGLDSIRSVKKYLDSLTITTTKHPKSLVGAPYFKSSKIKLDEISEKTVLYEGNAITAIEYFPANVNVAVSIALAGIGLEKTQVRIIADPMISVNKHEILGKGSFGEILIIVQNIPSPANPRTSYLASLSAIECLRSLCNENFRIGT
ncbi:MAG: aspartate dehydrogenase [Thaumarchaeota archaeon]|nr:MAG: aspartate dehydrogenase [Nitrososphaerota archaeon]TLX92284.1 MAG: aspartate dehydrogenase [Nitrososphaerota archaeon]